MQWAPAAIIFLWLGPDVALLQAARLDLPLQHLHVHLHTYNRRGQKDLEAGWRRRIWIDYAAWAVVAVFDLDQIKDAGWQAGTRPQRANWRKFQVENAKENNSERTNWGIDVGSRAAAH